MLPEGNTLLNRSYEVKKLLYPMGLEYVIINPCGNHCILYRKEYEKLNEFLRHRDSRYKLKDNGLDDDDGLSRNDPPTKVVWYLPIISRFKKLFSNLNNSNNIR